MSTLVVCLYRGTGLATDVPVVGRESVEQIVTTVGVEDPENSRINCILEGLRVANDLDDGFVAVVSAADEPVSGDRAIANQIDQLVADYDPDSAVVIVDSADDERLVPIIESRIQVDAVDRVVVRQDRDIESTYYLLKQFLADEELRKTVLIPIGVALLAFPALLFILDSTAVALSAIAAVVGLFLLYKGLSIDHFLANLSAGTRDALYSGQVSLVTYIVGGGLALVGVFVGLLGASSLDADMVGELIVAMQFVYDAIPWVTAAALTASAGRLLDEFIRDDEIRGAYVNLPFVAVAVGLAVRGFSAYFLQRSDVLAPLTIPDTQLGAATVDSITIAPGTHLAVFVLGSIVLSLIGVRVAAYVSSVGYDISAEGPGSQS